jgi:staphylococcal nuclease domain-containing protein 1
MWEARTNLAVALLEAGLAKLQTSFGSDRIPDIHLLEQAEKSAKRQKLKVRSRTCFILPQFFLCQLC